MTRKERETLKDFYSLAYIKYLQERSSIYSSSLDIVLSFVDLLEALNFTPEEISELNSESYTLFLKSVS